PHDLLILDFEQLMRQNEGNAYLKAVGNNGWQLLYQHEENIDYIEILKFQEGKGRIDYNPNKISQFLAGCRKSFIHELFL
ncbi:replication protein, partial [Enterococcus faecium]